MKLDERTSIVIGGFGIDKNGHHRRLDDVVLIDMESKPLIIKAIKTVGYGPGKYK